MRVAIFGTGQLARMLAAAAQNLNVDYVFVGSKGESTQSVFGLGEIYFLEDYSNTKALYMALGRPDVVTVEKESVPVSVLRELQSLCNVYPSPDAIAVAQHRGFEKSLASELGIPTARFSVVNEVSQLVTAAHRVGFPLIAKSLMGGYDGNGQWLVTSEQDLFSVSNEFPECGVILEEKIDFLYEVSMIGARAPSGDVVTYPPTENKHSEGVLISSIAPASSLSKDQISQLETAIHRLFEFWQYVGVMALEFFVTQDGVLLNEVAPRVHNSGHWTLQPGICSQFENHIRAITGMALGSVESDKVSAMVNVLGHYDLDRIDALQQITDCHLYWYHKSSKPRRKLGHITVQGDERSALLKNVQLIEKHIYCS